jgi:glucose-1-phosphatase
VAAVPVRALVFDIGGVIVRTDVKRALGNLADGSLHSPAEALQLIQTDPRWQDWQEGRIAPREWHAHLSARLGMTVSFGRFCEIWNRALDPAPILSGDFFADLSAHYKLALLSNTDPIHVAHQEATFSFFRFFPTRVYSCSVGLTKPHPGIYRRALAACGIHAPEAVYIDDVESYVVSAQRLGMRGIVFSGPEQLKESLRALDVKV